MFWFLLSCFHHPIELVESTPLELKADDPLTRNTALVWKQLFSEAENSIDIGCFYISPGGETDSFAPIWQELKTASQRGVQLRILVDKHFSSKYPAPLEEIASWKNTELRLSDYSPSVMHAKYTIIDKKKAFVGSQNFDYRALDHIFELGYLVSEKRLVQNIQDIFEMDWQNKELSSSKSTSSNHPYSIVAAPPNRLPGNVTHDLPHILRLIDQAQSRIEIQLLSYSNFGHSKEHWYVLDEALIGAQKRGVEVHLLVSDWSIKGKKGKSIKNLAAHGINLRYASIPKHSSGPIPYARTIHSKFMVVDRKHCWLGTSNWSKDYFTQSRNIGILIKQKRDCLKLSAHFNRLYRSEWTHLLQP